MILNYTTTISADKTVAEIQGMLARAKAQAIMNEYEDGVLSALSFRIPTALGVMTFRLPANIDRVHEILRKSTKVPKRLQTRDQASKVAWRILKDWLKAQLALVEVGMVEIQQVFLPYAQDQQGRTVYENLLEKRFSGLLLKA